MSLWVNEWQAVEARMKAGAARYQWPPYTMDAAYGAEVEARGGMNAWAGWVNTFARSPHGETEELIGIDAYIDKIGNAVIAATCKVKATGRLLFRSPYFNQSPGEWHDGQTECPQCHNAGYGTCEVCDGLGYLGRMTEYDEIKSNPREWLDTMGGATDWEEWTWDFLTTGPRAACLGTPDGYIWLHSWRTDPEFLLVPLTLVQGDRYRLLGDYAPDRQRYPQPAEGPYLPV